MPLHQRRVRVIVSTPWIICSLSSVSHNNNNLHPCAVLFSLHIKPRYIRAHWFGNRLYGWGISSVSKFNILPQRDVHNITSSRDRPWKTTCFYHHASPSKVICHVFDCLCSLKRHKASSLEVLHKSIHSFPLSATRQAQVGDFGWLWTRLRFGWFTVWARASVTRCLLCNKMMIEQNVTFLPACFLQRCETSLIVFLETYISSTFNKRAIISFFLDY